MNLYFPADVRALMEMTDDVSVLRDLADLEDALVVGDELAAIEAVEKLYVFALRNGLETE